LAALSGEGFLYLADETVTAVITGDWENITNIPDRIKRLIELSAADGAIFLDENGNYRVVGFGVNPGEVAEGSHSHSTFPGLSITSNAVSTSSTTGSLLLDGIGIGGGRITTTGNITARWFNSSGNTGWFNTTYGGGVHMIDNFWVRIYGGKAFYVGSDNAAYDAFSGAAIGCPGVRLGAGNIYTTGEIHAGNGATGTFVASDQKIITVTDGIITGIN
jgi:hypothetical protein